MTTKTNVGLVAWAKSMLGQPYWWGCCCYKATNSVLANKSRQYPTHYTASRMSRYKADIARGATVADCCGLIKGFYWTRDDGTQIYGLDGRPDKGANGMYEVATVKGPISTLPEILGLLLYSPGHVGVYIGDGWAIEARGFNHGVVKTRVADRSWTAWYKCKFIDYIDGDVVIPTEPEYKPDAPGERDLYYRVGKPMQRGEDVHWVQETLSLLGYFPGDADGIFGHKTETAVRVFQAGWLVVNGVVGDAAWALLRRRRQEKERGEVPAVIPSPTPPDDEPTPSPDNFHAPVRDFGTRLLSYKKGRKLMTGSDVQAVQQRLLQLGYAPGEVDGQYGPTTGAAVRALQSAVGIEADGIVGPNTRNHLTR